ncbi:putative DNA-binding protein (plasmid) [Aliivibrio wodanis]|jgi:hypothetical protein|uniref:Putative DNA-binding protein n=1 Tax=Aliivibrio wodanis TaxID=80852 RepID=A0A090IBW5_9GAMM|nr:putative DNA-binding protein [Aliivibrio wodanis]
MAIDPTTNKPIVINEQYAQEAKTTLTRSEAAEARRTLEGMQKSYLDLRPIATNRMMEAAKKQDLTSMVAITADLESLEKMKGNIETITNMVNSAVIDTDKRTTSVERKEIRGFYNSGKYDQNDLAHQYDLSQPGISKILKSDN